MTATKVVKDLAVAAGGGEGGNGKLNATVVNGNVAPNQEAPRSDNPTPAGDTTPQNAAASPFDLKPAVAADPNELKPNVEPDPNALPPLQQSNQLENTGTSAAGSSGVSSLSSTQKEEMADISTSRKKKKKGLAKLKPF